MSLPDTVFIFVLALIIFGPKKLPEIGRQIGKLVGEFRRASNEFKFQIEEELRQVDLTDKPSARPTIAAPANTAATETSNSLDGPESGSDPAANMPPASLPVGQHPNIDTLDTAELNSTGMTLLGVNESALEAATTEPSTTPAIIPAEGAEARTTVPYAATPGPVEDLTHNAPTLWRTPAPENRDPAPAETEITHG